MVVLSLVILSRHLYTRISYVVFSTVPSYLGPSTTALTGLFTITCCVTLSLFALTILFLRTVYSLATNTYMIEAWEIERHESIIERSQTRHMRGYVYANGGRKVRVQKVEFPFDIGVWENVVQAMGTANVLMWFVPWARGPGVESAGAWAENGFNDREGMWPPPDPDKLGRRAGCTAVETQPLPQKIYGSIEEEREAFRQRQEADLKRWKKSDSHSISNGGDGHSISDGGDGFYEKENEDQNEDEDEEYVSETSDSARDWTNSEGERLRDYGVDDEVDIVDDLDDLEDEIPLGELLRRRKARNFDA
ncbi:Palmitoyltransferase [Ciborinia camelliae]|nr:Palmitoyltransferase [Ciborinia camelliae]